MYLLVRLYRIVIIVSVVVVSTRDDMIPWMEFGCWNPAMPADVVIGF
jgi:hypothetical protein